MPVISSTTGSRIRSLREAKRLTQHDLAGRLRKRGYGTTQTTVSRWESGQMPRGYVARALAEELGTTLDELFDSEDETEADPMERLRRIRAELVLAGRDDLAADLLKLLPTEARS